MTTAELIQQLQAYPPDMKVITEGYEEGYDDVVEVKLVKIKKTEKPKWYVGAYDNSDHSNAMSAIFINGANKCKDID